VNELGKPYNFPIPVQQKFLQEKLDAFTELKHEKDKSRLMITFHKMKHLIEK
jgi:hypothetical protein